MKDKRVGGQLVSSLAALASARDELSHAVEAQAQKPERKPTADDGIRDLAQKVDPTVLDDDTTATVTATQRVYKGDMVCLTHELGRDGDALRVAYERARLLAATSSQRINDVGYAPAHNILIWAFVQDGGTYLKTAKYIGGEWTLGATVYAGELEPERAVLVYTREDANGPSKGSERVCLLYENEGQGEGQIYALSDLTLTKAHDIVWCPTIPANFAAAWIDCRSSWNGPVINQVTGDANYISVAYQTEAGNIALVCISTGSGTVCDPVELTPGSITVPEWPTGGPYTFTLAAPDGQEYLSDAWSLVCYRRLGTCWLTYPGADGKRYVLEYTTVVNTQDGAWTSSRTAQAYGCKPLILNGYIPCGGGVSNLDTRENDVANSWTALSDIPVDGDLAEMPWLVGVISRTAGGNAQKSILGFERWMGGREHYLLPMGYIESADILAANVGLLRCCRCGPFKSALAAAYLAEGTVRAVIVYDLDTIGRSGRWSEVAPTLTAEPVSGPDVQLATADTGLELVEMDQAPAILYQRAGSIWLQALKVNEVAATTKSRRLADAVAVTGGSPGKTVKIVTLRTLEREEGEKVEEDAEA